MLDVIAIIISIIALIFSCLQFFSEKERSRKEATINALIQLQHDVFDQTNYFQADITQLIQKHSAIEANVIDESWEYISDCMARIEQFCVGINTKIYSLEILDRMAGSYFIKEYNRLRPIIVYKRERANTDKRYIEFETVVNNLKKYNPNL